MVMRRQDRRMAKCRLCSCLFFFARSDHLKKPEENVLVLLVRCKDLPSPIETFSLLGKTTKQKSIYLSHVFHNFPCYFG